MKNQLIYLFVFTCLASCQQNTTKDISVINEEQRQPVEPLENFEAVATEVSINVDKKDMQLDERTLFGKFHYNRVEFYVDKNPKLSFHNAVVRSSTLYFIDGILCKKRYQLATNISSKLVNQYGSFKFKALDWDTRESSEVMNVILTNDNLRKINPVLKKYRLQWRLDSATIKYRHEEDSASSIFIYEEEMPAYRNLMKSAERGLI